MEPFISDTHRSSVQGYLCFSTRLIRHAFFQSVCMCVCACACMESQRAIVSIFEFWPSFWPPVMTVRSFVHERRLTETPYQGTVFCFAMGICRFCYIFFFSLDSFEVSLNKSTDKHIHVRDTHSNTPLILTHTTTALRPFAFPTVYSCQAPWQPYGFFQWQ